MQEPNRAGGLRDKRLAPVGGPAGAGPARRPITTLTENLEILSLAHPFADGSTCTSLWQTAQERWWVAISAAIAGAHHRLNWLLLCCRSGASAEFDPATGFASCRSARQMPATD